MIKKILTRVRGFTPVELVIMVGFGALAAAALIFLATSPQYMAGTQSADVNLNIKVDSAGRQHAAKAQATCDSTYVNPNSLGGFDVTPASDVTKDAVNIQCAVDNADDGGTVNLLAGVFYMADAEEVDKTIEPSGYKINYDMSREPNYGNDQTIFIEHGVKVVGKKDSSGNHLTKLVGGYETFKVGNFWTFLPPRTWSYNFLYDALLTGPLGNSIHDVTIKDIEFLNPRNAAIEVVSVEGLNIEGNLFVDARGENIAYPITPNANHHPVAFTIILSIPNAYGIFGPPDLSQTSGQINIVNNEFYGHDRLGYVNDPWTVKVDEYQECEFDPTDPDCECAEFDELGNCISGLKLTGNSTSFRGITAAMRAMGLSADLNVVNNKVYKTGIMGFTSEDNLSIDGVGGNSLIANNTIESSPLSDFSRFSRDGFWAKAENWCVPGYCLPTKNYGPTNLVVKENNIKMSAPIVTGAIDISDMIGAVITKNNIEFTGNSEFRLGINIWHSNDSVFSQNKMIGTSTYGFSLFADAANNVFIGNNIANLNSELSYLFTYDFYDPENEGTPENNIVKGYTGGTENIIDDGTNNLLTGVDPMSGTAIGQQVSDAMEKLRDFKAQGNVLKSGYLKYLEAHPEIDLSQAPTP